MPEGYLIRQTGPNEKVGKGEREMNEMIRELERKGCSRCPFSS
jgi:hypothetical protein